ncbi:MAG TPA: hypothetical protein VMY39_10785, partial [Planctomycetota bacterium]|nr:hypothetical protein [Planctomycetota bacterium]
MNALRWTSALRGSVVLVALVVAGCETHQALVEPNPMPALARLAAADPDQAVKLGGGVDPAQIAGMLDTRVQLRFPTTLTVTRLTVDYYGGVGVNTLEAEELNAWEKVVGNHPQITGVLPLSPVAVKYRTDINGRPVPLTMGDLREAAARQQSGLILVYVQAES